MYIDKATLQTNTVVSIDSEGIQVGQPDGEVFLTFHDLREIALLANSLGRAQDVVDLIKRYST